MTKFSISLTQTKNKKGYRITLDQINGFLSVRGDKALIFSGNIKKTPKNDSLIFVFSVANKFIEKSEFNIGYTYEVAATVAGYIDTIKLKNFEQEKL